MFEVQCLFINVLISVVFIMLFIMCSDCNSVVVMFRCVWLVVCCVNMVRLGSMKLRFRLVSSISSVSIVCGRFLDDIDMLVIVMVSSVKLVYSMVLGLGMCVIMCLLMMLFSVMYIMSGVIIRLVCCGDMLNLFWNSNGVQNSIVNIEKFDSNVSMKSVVSVGLCSMLNGSSGCLVCCFYYYSVMNVVVDSIS